MENGRATGDYEDFLTGFVLPDGNQYWCGGHAVARPEPVGSLLDRDLPANIRQSLPPKYPWT